MASTTRMVSARERARRKAAEYRERERKLEDLAVVYFHAADEIEKVNAQRDRDLAKVRERAERAAAAAVGEADEAIRAMLALNVPQPEVRERLGCTVADVRRATSTVPAAAADSSTVPAADRADGAESGPVDVPNEDLQGDGGVPAAEVPDVAHESGFAGVDGADGSAAGAAAFAGFGER